MLELGGVNPRRAQDVLTRREMRHWQDLRRFRCDPRDFRKNKTYPVRYFAQFNTYKKSDI